MITEKLLPTEDNIARAAAILRRGGLVGMPTETVYGLAASALDPDAVRAIFEAKGRPQDNPLIVHIAEFSDLDPLVTAIPPTARAAAEAFWPGPFTMILPKSDRIPSVVSAGLDTVAVRMPSDPVAHALIQAAGLPLAAPSANRSGLPSPTTAERVVEDMDGRIDAVLMAGPCSVGVESTVVSFACTPPRLLRPGGITVEQLRRIIPDLVVDPAVLNPVAPDQKVASPGMKYKHYAPRCRVTMVEGSPAAYAAFVNRHTEAGTVALCFEEDLPAVKIPAVTYGRACDQSSQSEALFDALRRLDDEGYDTAFAHAPALSGVGLAVYNRLIRAAAFQVVKV